MAEWSPDPQESYLSHLERVMVRVRKLVLDWRIEASLHDDDQKTRDAVLKCATDAERAIEEK